MLHIQYTYVYEYECYECMLHIQYTYVYEYECYEGSALEKL